MLELYRIILSDIEFQSLLMKYIGIFELGLGFNIPIAFQWSEALMLIETLRISKTKITLESFLKDTGRN